MALNDIPVILSHYKLMITETPYAEATTPARAVAFA